MNYYEHHLGDYVRDTAHLSMLEEGAYRRLIDIYYTKEAPLPIELERCFRLVRARSKAEKSATETVLKEFFEKKPNGRVNKRCETELARFNEKREKAVRSARIRWSGANGLKEKDREENARSSNAPAIQRQCRGNARAMPPSNQDPIPSNHSPVTTHQTPRSVSLSSSLAKEEAGRAVSLTPLNTPKKSKFLSPTAKEVWGYMQERGKGDQAEAMRFCDFYASKGWMVGKNKMRDWQAAVRNWTRRAQQTGKTDTESIEQFKDRVSTQAKRALLMVQDLK